MTSLGYAILGLLAREPMSGYDVAQKLKVPLGYFWHASHSQIYPELEGLHQQGLVTQRLVEQKRRPDKKIFTITLAGRKVLEVWVTEPVVPPPIRDELLLKTYSSWTAEPEHAAALFRTEHRRYLEGVARFEAIERQVLDEYRAEIEDPSSPTFAAYATLRAGLALQRAWAAWCDWIATSIETRRTKDLPRARPKRRVKVRA